MNATRFLAWTVMLAAALPLPALGGAGTREDRQEFVRELKRLEHELIHSATRAEWAERRAWLARYRAGRAAPGVARRNARGGEALERPRDAEDAFRRQWIRPARERARVLGETPDPADNHLLNDRSRDMLPGSTQSELSIAARGAHLVAAWNDVENGGLTGALGYAFSSDSGATWIDGGPLPLGPEVLRWVSDPVVTADERTGVFYLAAMSININGPRNGIAVLRGEFSGSRFEWSPPVVTRSVRDTLPDKPWVVADSTTGNLYLSYTTFFRVHGEQVDQIEFQRSTDDNRHWSLPVRLSADRDLGMVQGSRPATGPDGDLHITWMAVDTTLAAGGRDALRFRTSTDFGASFGAEEDAARPYSNFGSGPPGFNRGYGLMFPSLAVDRTHGPHRGRVYVAWNEGMNYYDDAPGGGGARIEIEPNAYPGISTPFDIGETLRGTIESRNDLDTYRFDGAAGTTVVFYLDSLATSMDVALRVLCADGSTQLAYSAPVWRGRPRVVVATIARSDRFYVVISPIGDTQGGYRLRTGLVQPGPEPGRDQRDVFVAVRDRGGRWQSPVRVNDDPALFDQSFPEVAVAADGRAYVAWYDWRDSTGATCGSQSNTYLARSDDGGSSWRTQWPVSDAPTAWSDISSTIAPNMGDYIGLAVDATAIVAAWADGRYGDPDAFAARVPYAFSAPGPLSRHGAWIERVSPNPATESVQLDFSLERAAEVRIDVLDLQGRKVFERGLGPYPAGRQSVRVSLGEGLRPGVYVVSLRGGAASNGTRLVILPRP